MSQLLLNMAQQAVKDPSLMAGFIDSYTKQVGSSWAEIADELQISPTQLAKLALCRHPNGNAHQEIRQIADFIKMSPVVLNHFYELAQNGTAITSNNAVPSKKTIESSKKKPFKQSSIYSIGSNFMSKRYVWATGLVVVLLLIVSAFVMAQSTAVSEATLVVNEGEVIISRAGTDKLYTAVSGEAVVVTEGDTVTTSDTATAQLHLKDGGTVELFAATSVEITELVTTEENYQVTLTMLAGRTLNRVVHLLGVNDHYEVRTPSSTASVRGTVFMVDVLSQESTHVVVDEGIVNVAMGDQSVDVKAGFEVTAVVGELLIVKPQHQETPIAPTTVVPTVTPTVIPTATPTTTPIDIAFVATTKGSAKIPEAVDVDGLPTLPPPAIGNKINPDQPDDDGDTPDRPGAGHTDDPTDDPEKDPSENPNGGNPHDGMVVPGSTSTDSNGSPPAGGAEPPGQGGTPPGQTSNPGNGGDNNAGGNSDNNGNSGNNGGGKKDK